MLEDDVRATFAGRIGGQPILDDPATGAIRRARAVRRRRRAGGFVAAAVVGAVFTGGLVYLQDWRVDRERGTEYGLAGVITPEPEASTPEPLTVLSPPAEPQLARGVAAQVDLYVGGRLWTASGERLSTPDIGGDARLYRVPSGWLIGSERSAYLLRGDGSSVVLPLAGRWVVSADGTQVAYPDGPSTIRVGTLSKDGVKLVASAAVPVGALPVTFAGDRLVLELRAPDGSTRQVDHWLFAKHYSPTWTVEQLDVYDSPGAALLARVKHTAAGENCLVRLAAPAAGLHVDGAPACGLGLTSSVTVSPDGRWLAAPVGQVVSFYDLTVAFEHPMPTAVCGVPDMSTLVWEDATGLVAGNGLDAVRCRPDGTTEQVPLPVGLPDGWRLVPVRVVRTG